MDSVDVGQDCNIRYRTIGGTAARGPGRLKIAVRILWQKLPAIQLLLHFQIISHSLFVARATKCSHLLACPIASLCNRPAHWLGNSFGTRSFVALSAERMKRRSCLERSTSSYTRLQRYPAGCDVDGSNDGQKSLVQIWLIIGLGQARCSVGENSVRMGARTWKTGVQRRTVLDRPSRCLVRVEEERRLRRLAHGYVNPAAAGPMVRATMVLSS